MTNRGDTNVPGSSNRNDTTTQTSSNDDKNQTTSSSTSFSLTSWFTGFFDGQRIERLKQCKELEALLRHCQEARRQQKPYDSAGVMEESICGIRMLKYFEWRPQREPQEDRDDHNDKAMKRPSKQLKGLVTTAKEELKHKDGPAKTKRAPPETSTTARPSSNVPSCSACAMETHAMWACRAIALGCAADLVPLKDCFQQYDQGQLLNSSETNYEAANKYVPCAALQQSLGACIAKSAAQLNERVQNRGSK